MIRHARPADVPAIVAAYDWLFAPPGVRPPDWSPAIAADRLKAAMADDRSAVLIADDSRAASVGGASSAQQSGNTVVGFATIYLDFVSVRFGQRAWVEDLAVAPHRRSSGIGKALLDAAKAWARDHGAARLGLESGSARVDAHRFYERERPESSSRSFKWRL